MVECDKLYLIMIFDIKFYRETKKQFMQLIEK